MNKRRTAIVAALTLDAAIAVAALSCDDPPRPPAPVASASASAPSLSSAVSAPLAHSQPSLATLCSVDAAVPQIAFDLRTSLPFVSNGAVDCTAWQDFIALNWPASPDGGAQADAAPSSFGAPGQTVYWEGFADRDAVMAPALDAGAGEPADCQSETAATRKRGHPFVHRRLLSAVTEEMPGSYLQAGTEKWLADTNGELVYYEVKLDAVEQQYIVDAGLSQSANQAKLSRPGATGVRPPTGSIEMKAAWRRIPDGQAALYQRYLTVEACVPAPSGKAQVAHLGLVGLHILHKMDGQPNWVWETFEQVDNAPTHGADAGAPDGGWAFYDPACTPKPIAGKCVVDAGPTPDGGWMTSCVPNTMPPLDVSAYVDGGSDACAPYPIQVERATPISSTADAPVQQINQGVQAEIIAANPGSVFQYYELVNSMWISPQAGDLMQGGVATPISLQGNILNPPGAIVANTMLETYLQGAGSPDPNCFSCHVYAPIAGDGGSCNGAPCASDFSFVFSSASR